VKSKTAVAAPAHPTWQSVIDMLRLDGHTEEVRYMENLRRAAKDSEVTTEQLTKMIGKL
jgi:hypothetical protein